jgi:hypothetical protein
MTVRAVWTTAVRTKEPKKRDKRDVSRLTGDECVVC